MNVKEIFMYLDICELNFCSLIFVRFLVLPTTWMERQI